MSLEDLATAFGEAVDRGRFLRKAGVASLGAVFVTLGMAAKASAYNYACCTLCDAPAQGCGGDCTWCWQCCQSGTKYNCCEHYALGQGCAGGCPAYCSSVAVLGSC